MNTKQLLAIAFGAGIGSILGTYLAKKCKIYLFKSGHTSIQTSYFKACKICQNKFLKVSMEIFKKHIIKHNKENQT